MKQLLFNHSWKQRLHQFVLTIDELHNQEIMEIISRRFCPIRDQMKLRAEPENQAGRTATREEEIKWLNQTKPPSSVSLFALCFYS